MQAGSAAGADPLAALRATGGALVAPLIDAFSFLAVATSFIGFILGLNDFWSDRLQVGTCTWMAGGYRGAPWTLVWLKERVP